MNAALRIGALAMLVECAWAQGSAQELAGAAVQRWSKEQPDRTKGLSNVIRTDGQRAVLLLSGVPLTGNSGDDTILGIGFSGVYEAQGAGGRWTLGRRIPLEELGQALTLAYDREWKILNENVDGVRLELLVTPDMRPEAAAIQQEFRRVNSLLASRFGPLKSRYFAVVRTVFHFAGDY